MAMPLGKRRLLIVLIVLAYIGVMTLCNHAWAVSGGGVVGVVNGQAISPSSITKASINGAINVAAPPYNAVCDDTTDNTATFQSALSALSASGTLYVPTCSSAYRINSCLLLNSPTFNTIRITGAGSSALSPSVTPPYSSYASASTLDLRGQCAFAVITAQAGGPSFTPTAASDSATSTGSGIATFTMASTTGLAVGQQVTITGMTPSGYNATAARVLSVDSTHITIAVPSGSLGAGSVFGSIVIVSGTLPQATIIVDSTAGFTNGTNAITINGQAVTCTGTTSTTFTGCSGGTGIVLTGMTVEPTTGTAAVAKIDTRSHGRLVLDHLNLEDKGTDCSPFIQTTNTVLNVDNIGMVGTAANTSACNDAYIFGGTTTAISYNANAPFQGYGTRITGGEYAQIRRVGVFQTYANAIIIDGGYVTLQSGSNLPRGASIELYPNSDGNDVTNLQIEVSNYPYAIKLVGSAQNDFIGVGYWDPSTPTLAFNDIDDTSSTSNQFVPAFMQTLLFMQDAQAASAQTVIANTTAVGVNTILNGTWADVVSGTHWISTIFNVATSRIYLDTHGDIPALTYDEGTHAVALGAAGVFTNSDLPFLPPKDVIANLPCASNSEGSHFVATNCNAACSVGGTCTAGGSTHCEMYCTGSTLVETGR